ncbi:MAG TPA: N-acetylglucosamine-6-phosphate deacetylase [Solirubrobacterales bacterium]
MRIAGTVVFPDRVAAGWVEIEGERIGVVGEGRPPGAAEPVDGLIAPGLCDLQVNGAIGREVVEGPEALAAIDAHQLRSGVTNYLATVISRPFEAIAEGLEAIAEAVHAPEAGACGVHFEGPFLNPDWRGIHRREHVREAVEALPAWYERPEVRLVTLAPELPGALEAVRELSRRGVAVSLGHTGAGPEAARRAVEAGARAVTHVFNAMPGLHHREPGFVGWALEEPRVAVGVIPDGVHVSPTGLRLVRAMAGPRILLVSDSSPATGAPEGTYSFGGVEIRREGERALDAESRLAGSCIDLAEGLRRWVGHTGAPLPEAFNAASVRPGRLIGLELGVRQGALADLVVWSQDLEVRRIMRRGAWLDDL